MSCVWPIGALAHIGWRTERLIQLGLPLRRQHMDVYIVRYRHFSIGMTTLGTISRHRLLVSQHWKSRLTLPRISKAQIAWDPRLLSFKLTVDSERLVALEREESLVKPTVQEMISQSAGIARTSGSVQQKGHNVHLPELSALRSTLIRASRCISSQISLLLFDSIRNPSNKVG